MFTGIVQSTGIVKNIFQNQDILQLTINAPKLVPFLKHGDSISIDGACYTIVSFGNESFMVEAMPETFERTILRFYKPEAIVNLELSLQVGDRIHGHFVQGHVDTTGKVLSIRNTGKSKALHISLTPQIKPFIAFKGSICINGVSLTVSAVDKNFFEVSLIPQTLASTNLRLLEEGSHVNIEIDTLARYLVNLIHENSNQPSS